ncbi:acyl carrier protein [Vallitalea guaymasensis]|uniref:Acyl carrier protein n=1 Tax=Vallitalea guaymasensis TaxID=1185412 RepID=A0A8J8M8W2_9FIRM|nr:acyl carrier protein [Vallitalea guaymasensis]QUH28458.1 acyl carrier protein [Vallitalea guaymasensis]
MNKEQILEIISRNIGEVLPDLEGYQAKPSDKLVDLGANSVDRAEIVMMTMEELSLNIPRVELFGVSNIGELAEVIYEKLQ